MQAKLKINGKEAIIDMDEVSGIKNFTGLMFNKNSNALLFEIKNKAIHSCFCQPFLAIWLLEGKIIDYKLIEPWKFSIKPEKDFDKLIEIPLNKKYEEIMDLFLKEGKI